MEVSESSSKGRSEDTNTAKNNLVIGVVKPILQKLRPTYGRTNQPKLTENIMTTLWPSSLYDHRYGHNMYSKRIIDHTAIPMARLMHQNMKIQPFFMISLNIQTLQTHHHIKSTQL